MNKIGIVAIIVVAAALFRFFSGEYSGENIELTPSQEEDLRNLKNAVKSLNQKISPIRLEEQPSLFNKNIVAYKIIIPDPILFGLFRFESQKYTFKTSEGYKVVASLADEVQRLSSLDETKLRKEFQEIGKLTFDGKKPKIEIEPLGKILYTIRDFIQLSLNNRQPRIGIAIRGFADGQQAPWVAQLEEDYLYQKISVLRSIDPQLNTGFISTPSHVSTTSDKIAMCKSRNIDESKCYDNSALPNLRAEFIKQGFIEPYIEKEAPKNVDVFVLDGFASETPKNQLERKAEIYLMVITKRR